MPLTLLQKKTLVPWYVRTYHGTVRIRVRTYYVRTYERTYVRTYNVMSQLSDWKRAHMYVRTYVRTRARTEALVFALGSFACLLVCYCHRYAIAQLVRGGR